MNFHFSSHFFIFPYSKLPFPTPSPMSSANFLRSEPENATFTFEKCVPIPPHPPKRREICIDFQYGKCTQQACPYRHTLITDQQMLQRVDTEVCKYWLRGLCTEGADCLWLHEFVKEKVPVCIYFQKFGECGNPECIFRHEHTDSHILCAAYARGFCAKGPDCPLKHQRAVACPEYLRGYCPDGPYCRLAHPKMEFYDEESVRARVREERIAQASDRNMPHYELSTLLNTSIVCDRCRDPGHIAPKCPNAGGNCGEVMATLKEIQEPGAPPSRDGCYSCGALDHIARNCPKRSRPMQGARYE